MQYFKLYWRNKKNINWLHDSNQNQNVCKVYNVDEAGAQRTLNGIKRDFSAGIKI